MISINPIILLIGFILVLFETLIIVLLVSNTKRYAPEAVILTKARKNRLPLAMLHYPGGITRLVLPTIEKEDEKSSIPNLTVKGAGIKFRDIDGTKTELFNGNITLYHYFKNMPEPVSTFVAVAISQLNDYLKEHDSSIENFEDDALFILSEYEKTGDVVQAIEDANIENKEAIHEILKFLDHVKKHKKEISEMKLESGVFTYQTAIRSIDSIISYTSANVAHMKSVLEASLRNKIEDKRKDLINMGVMIFIVLIGTGALLYMLK